VASETPSVRCTGCGRLVPVPEEWRMVECPACHTVMTRMDEDSGYD
jgi:Zn finger protein HypA/HybF involved in hydrogenase expression